MALTKDGRGFSDDSNFKNVVSKCYYVDKTLFIRELIDEYPKHPAMLFTRPRRFGKSLNLSMIKTFFEKTDKENSVYFKDLNIWKCGEKYTSEQGKYPVIFMDFKDITNNTWEKMRDNLKDMIMSEYKRHHELKGHVSGDNVDKYERIVKGTGSEVDYESSLKFLTDILYEFHGVQPIILIDEYDTPVQKGHDFGFYDKIIDFIRSFF
ncbi:MAG: AAA family ATPase, partial [Clostridia bacterium]|nr:AAA family ATPase [Clostridia bacterium]